MLLLLGKDLITFILEMCIEYNQYSKVNLNSILSIALTCKSLSKLAQNIINRYTYVYNIYQQSIECPVIVDTEYNVYTPKNIGNNVWFLSVKRKTERFIFVDKACYDYYDCSDRYFEDNCVVIKGKINTETTYYQILDEKKCFTIHYKAQFGEILLLTWYDKYTQEHNHIKMQWTEGDVWVGVICVPSDIHYRYEVCLDKGGPIVRKEKQYRESNSIKVVSDIWDHPDHPNQTTQKHFSNFMLIN